MNLRLTGKEKLQLEHIACSSNEILSQKDRQNVRQLLAEVQGEVSSLETDIARLKIVVENLKKQRKSEIERLSRLKVGIAPHKTLPPEILAKIFTYCTSGHPIIIGQPSVDWILCQICTRWRTIARAEPLLWPGIEDRNYSRPSYSATTYSFRILHDIL